MSHTVLNALCNDSLLMSGFRTRSPISEVNASLRVENGGFGLFGQIHNDFMRDSENVGRLTLPYNIGADFTYYPKG